MDSFWDIPPWSLILVFMPLGNPISLSVDKIGNSHLASLQKDIWMCGGEIVT